MVKTAWDSGQIQSDEYTDSYGAFRSVFLPMRGVQGQRYVIGADITAADSVAAAMRQVLWRQLGIGAAMLLIGRCSPGCLPACWQPACAASPARLARLPKAATCPPPSPWPVAMNWARWPSN